MGKRSDFPRRKADQYYSPAWVVRPLLPFLEPGTEFIEPCAGAGDLIRALQRHGMKCVQAYDIDPGCLFIRQRDALKTPPPLIPFVKVITNPPWTRQLLHPMIDRFRRIGETWLLFDAAWSHTAQARAYLPYCSDIVSVGRVKWFEDTEHVSMDDVAWYRFVNFQTETRFHNV